MNRLPRPMIEFIQQNSNGRELIGAEIGVYKGENAESILQTLPIKKLYLIDPYKYYTMLGELRDYSFASEIAHKSLKPYSDKIEFICEPSSKAVDFIPDDLDFLYADGNHNFLYIRKDIKLYYSKVKPGGVIGGHDFTTHFGVKLASTLFSIFGRHKLHKEHNDWWLVKDKDEIPPPHKYSPLLDEAGVILERISSCSHYQFLKRNREKIKNICQEQTAKRCFILATGKSIKNTNLSLIKNEPIIGVNTLYRGLKELKVKPKYYALTDERVFQEKGNYRFILNLDTHLFLGARLASTYFKKGHMYNKTKSTPLLIRRLGHMNGRFSTDISKGAYNGGSVMILVLQMAFSLGFKEVYLIGCDYTRKDGKHFDGKSYGFKLHESEVERSRRYVFSSYEICKRIFEEDNRKIYNATVGGNLEVFERKSLDEIFREDACTKK